MSNISSQTTQSAASSPSATQLTPELEAKFWEGLTRVKSVFDAVKNDSRLRIVGVNGHYMLSTDDEGGIAVARIVVTSRDGNIGRDELATLVQELTQPVADKFDLERDSGEEPEYVLLFLNDHKAGEQRATRTAHVKLPGSEAEVVVTLGQEPSTITGTCEIVCFADSVQVDTWNSALVQSGEEDSSKIKSFKWGDRELGRLEK